METYNFYRIKTTWTSEREDKSLTKTKTEELVYASCYTEAERIAYALIERYNRTQYGSAEIEIVKTKIQELLWNNILQTDDVLVGGMVSSYFSESDTTGVGMYQVKVYYTEVDLKTAKESHATEVIFTPAGSNDEATKIILDYLKKQGETRDYVVRDTKFDKAEAILWPSAIHQRKIEQMA